MTVKERPILFSAPMVRALLDGTKTQTRRVANKAVRHPDLGNLYAPGALVLEHEPQHVIDRACPYGRPGDRLWVRETFLQGFELDPVTDCLRQFDAEGNEIPKNTWYRATSPDLAWADDDGWQTNPPWKPSIHMPRALSRITLEITGVRVERLNDCSEADAQAEGTRPMDFAGLSANEIALLDLPLADLTSPYRNGYALLWDSINGAGSWAANPWVWVVEFPRV